MPDAFDALHDDGRRLSDLHQFEAGEHSLRAAIALRPEEAAPHYDLGALLRRWNRPAEAEACFQAAIRLSPLEPRAHLALAEAVLAQGRLREGFALREYRATPNDRLALPRWRGEPLEGRSLLFVHDEGRGDLIQMARYLPPLIAAGAKVSVLCKPEMCSLMAQLAPAYPLQDGVDLPNPELWVPPFSMPFLFGDTMETIPPTPYLRAPGGVISPVQSAPGRRRIGIVSRGSPTNPRDHLRSMASPAPLLGLASADTDVVDLQALVGDFGVLAAAIDQLDLVISVDTALAHLAGAMGKPCWLLLPRYNLDWRWMVGRDDSPWYPSMRLMRQSEDGDWAGLIEEVRGRLSTWTDIRRA